MKKIVSVILAVVMLVSLAACGGDSHEIGVIAREDGSGTRSAFEELFKIEELTASAVISSSTSIMMTTVAGDPNAIGYASLGALNDTVKVLSIDGVEATLDNVKNGTYTVSRPFNIATKEGLSAAAQDFINYILSADGQAVVEDAGYIAVSEASAYTASTGEGKVIIHGSSSVTPVMEKLKEAYNEVNPGVEIEIQQSDSSTGMTNTIDGTCDIGMASRDLKASEREQGLTATVIAMDGIAVIVHHDCPVSDMTQAQVTDIFSGNVTTWDAVTNG